MLFHFLRGQSGQLARERETPRLREGVSEFGLFSTISKVLVIIFEDIFFTFDGYFRAKYDIESPANDSEKLRTDLFEKSDFIMQSLQNHFDGKYIFTGSSLRLKFPLDAKEESLLDPVIAGVAGELHSDYNMILAQIAQSRMDSQELVLFAKVMLGSKSQSCSFDCPPKSTSPGQTVTDWADLIGPSVGPNVGSQVPRFSAVVDKSGHLRLQPQNTFIEPNSDKTPFPPKLNWKLEGGFLGNPRLVGPGESWRTARIVLFRVQSVQ